MKRLLTAATAIALGLGAVPALAGESPNAAALTEHYNSLGTPEFDACFDFDNLDPQTREKSCMTAIKQIEAARADKRVQSVGETANFDYRLVALQAGLAASYAQQDRTMSQRACKLIESNVALRARLKMIPESELSSAMFENLQTPPERFFEVASKCRDLYGTPSGAPPLGE